MKKLIFLTIIIANLFASQQSITLLLHGMQEASFRNYKEGFDYLKKACKLHNGIACTFIGYLYQEGIAVKQNSNLAQKYYKQGYIYAKEECDLKNPEGCYYLGLIYKYTPEWDINIKEIKKNLSIDRRHNIIYYYIKYKYLAYNYALKKCKTGDALACSEVGVLLMNERPQKALSFFMKGCELGDSMGCGGVGLLFDEGLGAPQNKKVALKYYKKACNMGFTLTCDPDHIYGR